MARGGFLRDACGAAPGIVTRQVFLCSAPRGTPQHPPRAEMRRGPPLRKETPAVPPGEREGERKTPGILIIIIITIIIIIIIMIVIVKSFIITTIVITSTIGIGKLEYSGTFPACAPCPGGLLSAARGGLLRDGYGTAPGMMKRPLFLRSAPRSTPPVQK